MLICSCFNSLSLMFTIDYDWEFPIFPNGVVNSTAVPTLHAGWRSRKGFPGLLQKEGPEILERVLLGCQAAWIVEKCVNFLFKKNGVASLLKLSCSNLPDMPGSQKCKHHDLTWPHYGKGSFEGIPTKKKPTLLYYTIVDSDLYVCSSIHFLHIYLFQLRFWMSFRAFFSGVLRWHSSMPQRRHLGLILGDSFFRARYPLVGWL